MSNQPLWERLGLQVPKNVGFVTSRGDLSVAYQLRSVGGHAVRVASYDDLLSRVWRLYDRPCVACVSKLPEAQFVGGVDAYVLDGEIPSNRFAWVREVLEVATKPSLYLPRLRELEGALTFERVNYELSSYNPLLSV